MRGGAGQVQVVQRALDDQGRIRLLPVVRVVTQAGDQIAEILRGDQRFDFRRRRRLGVAQIGRPEQAQAPPRDHLEQPLGDVELEVGLAGGRRRDVGVGVGVAAHQVPFADLPRHQLRMRLHVLADDEEGRRRVFGLEDVENGRRPARIGTVVEGQRHQPRLGAVALHHIGRGHHLIVLVGDQPGVGVDRQGAAPGQGCGGDAQHLAVAVEVDVLGRRQQGQAFRDGLAVGVGQDRPDAGVLLADPPQGVAARAVVVSHLDLVEQVGASRNQTSCRIPFSSA